MGTKFRRSFTRIIPIKCNTWVLSFHTNKKIYLDQNFIIRKSFDYKSSLKNYENDCIYLLNIFLQLLFNLGQCRK